jgi:uncharacterized membrane protein YeaQ/YmgE (transglycosylase-associated protein family)
VNLIGTIIIGLLAGYIAGRLMNSRMGVIGDLILGLIGGVVGGWLTSLLIGVDLTGGFNLTTLIVSVIGAVVLIAIFRLIRGRKVTG